MKKNWIRGFAVVCASFALLCSLMLVGCGGSSGSGQASKASADQTITDDAGRQVTIPSAASLEKIYYTSAQGQILCFSLAPELAGGTAMDFTEEELKYLPEGTAELPNLGTQSAGKQLNPEALVSAKIQVIFSVSQSTPGEKDKTEADELQDQTDIPVVVLDGSYDKIPASYRTLGKLLGKQDAAEKLATYCEDVAKKVDVAVATVPDAQRKTLYYAEGDAGLQTEPETSAHALVFKLAGAKNVADVAVGSPKGMSDVSLEQVIAWDPQVIIAWDDMLRGGADEAIRTNTDWEDIQAVKTGQIYTMPNAPFSWCDRPASVNRYLGVQWVANLLYPEAYNVDMVEVTKEFYSTFYHADITDDQAKELLGNSYTK